MSFYKTNVKIFIASLFLFGFTAALANTKSVSFKKAQITVGQVKATVEIAETEEQLQQGLMFRKKLETNHGMLFIFSKEEVQNFWMKNTFVDLSIGFFDQKKKLVDIQEMKAVRSIMETPNTYQSRSAAQYALEMPTGWFKKNNIKLGEALKIQP